MTVRAADAVLAKVVSVDSGSITLSVGKETFSATTDSKTKIWVKRATGELTGYTKDSMVFIRLKKDTAPALLREIADGESQKWLDKVRKTIVGGKLKELSEKYATFALDDGTDLSYRATAKSKVFIKAKEGTLADLKIGDHYFLKGRTLATLDIWLVSASDEAPPKLAPASSPQKGSSVKTTKKPSKSVGSPLGTVGTIETVVDFTNFDLHLFDVTYGGMTIHINYGPATEFYLRRKKVNAGALFVGVPVKIWYRRDQFGRVFATKVELAG